MQDNFIYKPGDVVKEGKYKNSFIVHNIKDKNAYLLIQYNNNFKRWHTVKKEFVEGTQN